MNFFVKGVIFRCHVNLLVCFSDVTILSIFLELLNYMLNVQEISIRIQTCGFFPAGFELPNSSAGSAG